MVQTQPHSSQHNVGPRASLLFGEFMSHSGGAAASKKDHQDHDKSLKIMHQSPQLNFCFPPTTAPPTTTVVTPTTTTAVPVSSLMTSHVQGTNYFMVLSIMDEKKNWFIG